MNKFTNCTTLAALFYFSIIAVPQTAFAYIDPGTGSLMLQLLAAAFFGSLFTLKTYWKRLKSFFSRKTADCKPDCSEESDKEEVKHDK